MSGYRFGFNGKENDNEVKGEGNQQDYGMRIYDPRVGRFLSVDPLTKSYPWYTPYQFAGNTPIQAVDVDGREVDVVWFTKKYIEWVYGDPTGIKTLKAGIEQKAAIESRRSAYHNNDVPVNVQAKLDKVNTQVANAQILIGSAKLVNFNIETSLETTAMIAPVDEGVLIAGRSVLRLLGSQVERKYLGIL